MWGVNADGQIFHWDPVHSSWISIPGTLEQIAVGADGDVWGYNELAIYHLNRATGRFMSLPPLTGPGVYPPSVGSLSWPQPGPFTPLSAPRRFLNVVSCCGTTPEPVSSRVSVTSSLKTSAVLRPELRTKSRLRWTAGFGHSATIRSNTLIPVHRAFRFSRAHPHLRRFRPARERTSGVDSAGNIFQFDPGSTSWTDIPGQLNLIEVGTDGSVWGVNAAGQTYTYTNGGWTNIPGQLANQPGALSVGADGTVWGINPGQQIYRYDPGSQAWINVPGSLVQIAVGNATNIWGVNEHQQVYRYDAAMGWINVPGAFLVQIAVAFDGSVWGVNAAGSLYEWSAETQDFRFVSNGVTSVAVGNAAAVWAVNAGSGTVYNWF